MNTRPTPASSDKEIFLYASKLGTVEERLRLLDEVCVDAPMRRTRLLRMFEHIEANQPGILESAVEQIAPVTTSAQTFFDFLENRSSSHNADLQWDPNHLCGQTIGPYLLEEFLGSGGMGAVYRATQNLPISRTVALKIIRSDSITPKAIEAFNDERKTLERITHPGIVQVLDAGVTEDNIDYFVMEFVSGKSITDYALCHRLSTEDRIRLLIQVCRAVHHAHQRGVIHQDLKPANILVTKQGAENVVKIIDFGISRTTNIDLSDEWPSAGTPGRVFGTFLYMSPEQTYADPDAIDIRSDIYSLGLVAYELLCDNHPRKTQFESLLDRQSRMDWIRNEAPSPPSRQVDPGAISLKKALQRDLDWVILKAIAHSPNDRYASTNEFADDLQRFLEGLPVNAHPASAIYQTSKFISRHRPSITAFLVVCIILIATSIISFRQATIAKLARDRTEQLLFVADMKIASDAFQDGKISVARERLLRHKDVQESSSYPNFAWKYLWRELNPETRVFNFGGELLSIATSPDGTRLFSGDNAGVIHGWDLQADRSLGKSGLHRDVIRALSVSPSGQLLASGSDGGDIRIWSIPSFELLYVLEADSSGVNDLEWVDEFTFLSAAGNQLTKWELPKVGALLAPQSPSADEGPASAEMPPKSTPRFDPTGVVPKPFASFPRLVHGIAISPDRKAFATASQSDNELQRGWLSLFNSETNELLARNTTESRAIAVAFSPDGMSVAVGTQQGIVCLFNAKSISTPPRILPDHASNVYELGFTPDGRSLISASKDSTVRLWDVLSATQLRVFQGHERRVYGATYSPLTQRWYSASADGTVREFAPQRAAFSDITPANVSAISVVPGTTEVAPFTTRAFPRYTWDANSSELILSARESRLMVHDFESSSLAHLPFVGAEEAKLLGDDRMVLASRNPIYQIQGNHSTKPFVAMNSLADIDGDGRLDTVYKFNDRQLLAWISGTGVAPLKLLERDIPLNSALQFAGVSNAVEYREFVEYRGWDNTVCYGDLMPSGISRLQVITELPSVKSLWRCFPAGQNQHHFVTFDDRELVVTIYSLTLQSGSPTAGVQATIPVSTQGVIDLTAKLADSTGEVIAIYLATSDGKIIILQKSEENQFVTTQTIAVPHTIYALELKPAVSPRSEHDSLWVGGSEQITSYIVESSGLIREPTAQPLTQSHLVTHEPTLLSNVLVVDRDTQEVLSHFHSLDEHKRVAASPDGKWIATTGSSQKIHLWSSEGTWQGVFPNLSSNISEMQFTHDSKYLCVADADEAIIYDVHTLKRKHVLEGHENTVRRLAISSSSSLIATASHDTTVRIWDIESGELLKVLIGHADRIPALAFHPNEQLLVSGDEDGAIYFWDVRTGGELLRLSIGESVVSALFFENPERLIHIADDGNPRPLAGYSAGQWSIEKSAQ